MTGSNFEMPHLPVTSSPFSNIPIFIPARQSSFFNFTQTAQNTFDQATRKTRQYIKPHHESGSAYRFYGVADGINLVFSICNLWYMFQHAYHHKQEILTPLEFNIALQEFHAAEQTPEGFGATILFTMFLVGFSTIGSTATEKDAPWIKFWATLWPYVRDMLKQLKWTFKGVRALLALVAQNGGDPTQLVNLLFPLALAVGGIAMINRVWLRWMRDNRKEMLKINLELNDKIIAETTLLHKMSALPQSLKGFEYSLILIEDEDHNPVELYYVDANGLPQLHNLDASLENEISLENQILGEHIEHAENDSTQQQRLVNFVAELKNVETENIHAIMKRHLNYLLKDDKNPLPLHFVDNVSNLKNNSRYYNSFVYITEISEDQSIINRFQYINAEGNPESREDISTAFHAQYLKVSTDQNFLRFTAEQLRKAGGKSFDDLKLGYDYQSFTSSREEILSADPKNENIKDKNKIQVQNRYEAFLALFAATASAVFDGLYFYLYVATMAFSTLSPFGVAFISGASIILFITCVVTRFAEETDFQRRLTITTLRPKIALAKKEYIILHEQLELLFEMQKLKEKIGKDQEKLNSVEVANISKEIDRQNLLQSHMQLINLEKSLDITALNILIQKYKNAPSLQLQTDDNERASALEEFLNHSFHKNLSEREQAVREGKIPENQENFDDGIALTVICNNTRDVFKDCDNLQTELRKELNGSYMGAIMTGLQNGLAIQGAIASFGFMFSTIYYVSASTCPPLFILGCMSLGLAALILSGVQAWISYNHTQQQVKNNELALSNEFKAEELIKMTENKFVEEDRAQLTRMMEYAHSRPLELPSDYVVIEWSEIFRLFFSGFVKGNKAMIEIFGRMFQDSESKWMLPIIALAGAISFAVSLGQRACAKGFGAGKPDNQFKDIQNDMKGRSFFEKITSANMESKSMERSESIEPNFIEMVV